jgi:hypothetical protein
MRLLGQTTVNERHENVHEIDSSFALLAVDRSATRERSIFAQKKIDALRAKAKHKSVPCSNSCSSQIADIARHRQTNSNRHWDWAKKKIMSATFLGNKSDPYIKPRCLYTHYRIDNIICAELNESKGPTVHFP